MSSKKATSKAPAKASTSEKKAAKAAPAKKPVAKAAPAPAKKAAPAKAPAKAAPAKKPVAKAAPAPAKKAAPAKAPAKAAPAASAKKPVAKKDVPSKKEPAKVVKAAPAKAPAKAAPAKAVAETSKKPAPEKKVEPAVEAKAPVAPKKVVEKEVVKEVEKKIEKEPVKETVEKAPEKVLEKAEVVEKSEPKKSAVKSDYPYAVLLEGGKKPCKFIMFVEIDEQEERANKKKVTSEMKNLEKKPTSAIRHKISLAEETQEELTERILKELEEQNAAFTREAATQICTRCNKNLVSPEFWVDKHLGYCEECAAILHLGQSKEARKVEYQLGAMGGDSLDEVEDDDIEGPDAADLKEAEEELADFDD
ncbi:hypothetical protein [Fibrobacter succinogenes]|uniref:hypothetical protein n=1 Tax=Fibrobacter succinogenes TaxID=833 RepID=UPI0019D6336D|nr:hypothetical protein [Fibrobacter succinogenes]